MTSQYALQIVETGKPLVKITRPIPTPSQGEVVVKVTSAGLNPHDQKLRDLALWGAVLPLILADDVAGVVTSLGPGVTDLKVGDHIFSQSKIMTHTDTAGLQQYALLTSSLSAKIPASLSDDEAATIPVNAVAPFIALFHESGLGFPPPRTQEAQAFGYEGKALVIVGGGGNCGKFGVQFPKMVAFEKIIVIASLRDMDELKGLGATHVIDRHQSHEEIREQVHVIMGAEEVLDVYDALNDDHTLAVSLLSSEEKGKVAVLLPTKTLTDDLIGEKKNGYEVKKIFGASHA